jgi:hypothetical protein
MYTKADKIKRDIYCRLIKHATIHRQHGELNEERVFVIMSVKFSLLSKEK